MFERATVWALAIALGAIACNTEARKTTEPAPEPAPAANVQRYGAPIGAGESVKLSQVMATPEAYKDKNVVVEGEVRRACSTKGCWMEVAESKDAKTPGCRVTFKDYGFFVPKDSAGSHARMQAVVAVETVAAETVEHLEGEGAKFANKNGDGTANEVRLVASGVELSRK